MQKSEAIIEIPERCKNCGEQQMDWFADVQNVGGAQNGRIRLNEVRPIFVLGCECCSETLLVVEASKIAAVLNGQIEMKGATSGPSVSAGA